MIIRKVVNYIRSKFFRKKFDIDEAIDKFTNGFHVDVTEAALDLKTRIDEDIIESLARQAIAQREQHLMDLLVMGLEPKIYVRPPVTGNSEIIELENSQSVIRIKC